MMVQAVCLPSSWKMLVIPIFLPIIPFIVLRFMPRIGYRGHPADESGIQSLFATDLFLCFQYVVKTIEAEVPVVNKPRRACLYV
jgi:hypothetical protein